MGKKRNILQREQSQKKSLKPKQTLQKQHDAAGQRSRPSASVKDWSCASIVSRQVRSAAISVSITRGRSLFFLGVFARYMLSKGRTLVQAAAILRRILVADASRRAEASIRSLTLAPSVQAKKATHAVVCETLRNLELLRHILAASELLSKHASLTEEVACVLLYDLLLGQGLKPKGPAERALLSASDSLRAQLQESQAAMPQQPQLQSDQQELWPRYARVNLLKMTVQEALSWLRCPPAGQLVAKCAVRCLSCSHGAGQVPLLQSVRQREALTSIFLSPAGCQRRQASE